MLKVVHVAGATLRACGEIVRLAERRDEHFTLQSHPCFDGLASCFHELPQCLIDDELCEAVLDTLAWPSADRSKLRFRLRRFDRGGYLLPHSPIKRGDGADSWLKIIPLTTSDTDGDCVLSDGVCVRHLDRAGQLIEVHVDDWLWVSPVRSARRFSLLIDVPESAE